MRHCINEGCAAAVRRIHLGDAGTEGGAGSVPGAGEGDRRLAWVMPLGMRLWASPKGAGTRAPPAPAPPSGRRHLPGLQEPCVEGDSSQGILAIGPHFSAKITSTH